MNSSITLFSLSDLAFFLSFFFLIHKSSESDDSSKTKEDVSSLALTDAVNLGSADDMMNEGKDNFH